MHRPSVFCARIRSAICTLDAIADRPLYVRFREIEPSAGDAMCGGIPSPAAFQPHDPLAGPSCRMPAGILVLFSEAAVLAPAEEKYYQDFLAVLNQKWRPAKAAFYTLDPSSAKFRLKAQFGFSRTDRLAENLGRNDGLVTQIYERREPIYVNNVNQAGRLADAMVQATSTRMLLAPVYLDGRIMGPVSY